MGVVVYAFGPSGTRGTGFETKQRDMEGRKGSGSVDVAVAVAGAGLLLRWGWHIDKGVDLQAQPGQRWEIREN